MCREKKYKLNYVLSIIKYTEKTERIKAKKINRYL